MLKCCGVTHDYIDRNWTMSQFVMIAARMADFAREESEAIEAARSGKKQLQYRPIPFTGEIKKWPSN